MSASLSQEFARPDAIVIERRGTVGLIGLNRPEKINAINDQLREGLTAALVNLRDDPAIGAIVIHGGTGRGFCVGADITERKALQSPVAVRDAMTGGMWIDAFDKVPKPLIAAVHGYCLGGGLEIALACDIRIASDSARFSLPETGLGLIPGAGGTQRLHRIVGLGHALDMLLTGDRIDAAEAHRIGLITRRVDTDHDLLQSTVELAAGIADRAPTATAYVKEAAHSGADLDLASGLALERSLFALLTGTADKAEAARSFAEKRPPRFTGE